MATSSARQALVQAADQDVGESPGLWTGLQAKLDFAFYQPEAAPGIVTSELTGREGRYYVIKNPAAMTYYRLGERDYFLWQRMDGTRSVKDLVVAYFMEYGAFAFAQAAGLVKGLKAAHFLVEKPVAVYGYVQDQLERRTLEYRVKRVGNAFLERQFAINGLDGLLTTIYNRGGWLFYTQVFKLASLAIIIFGLANFLGLLITGRYSLVSAGDSLGLSVLALIAANFIAIMLHELGHALTVKHYEREVRRGGFMIYFGMPAFFIDTTDIWLAPKKARLAVTWAGPHASLMVGAVATLFVLLWPNVAFNGFIFKIAAFNFLGAFLNLNPLLELDGYYLLMDWLEIPRLRQISLAYIRSGLWSKLREGRENGLGNISFSREERIFVVFGVLAMLWSVIAIFMTISLWQERAVSFLSALWSGAGDAGRVGLALVAAALGAAGAFLVFSALRSFFRRSVAWAEERGLLDKAWYVAAFVWGVAVLLLALTGWGLATAQRPLANVAVLAIATIFAWRNARAFAGARLALVFQGLGLAAFGLLIAQGARLFVRTDASLFELVELLSLVPMLIATSLLFASHWPQTRARPVSALIVATPLVGLGLLGWLAFTQETPVSNIAGAALAPALAGVLCLPIVYFRRRTTFAPAWLSLCLALFGLAIARWLGLSTLLPFLLMASAYVLHYVAFARSRFPVEQPPSLPDLSDRDRLHHAFAWTLSAIASSLRRAVGERDSIEVTRRFNALAHASGWPIVINDDEIDDQPEDYQDLFVQGSTYNSTLSMFLDLAAAEVGDQLLGRMFQSAYDRLPWQAREIAALHLFPGVKQAAAADNQFQADNQAHHALLRRMPLFATMNEEELELLATQLRTENFRPGQVIMRQGETGDRFYIIKQGHIEVDQRDARGVTEIVDQLDRDAYLGELALLHDAPRNATCRATVATELLSLSRRDFERLVKERFALHEKLDETVTRTALLRRIPLFAELDSQQLQLTVGQLREETFEPDQLIIRQGDIGDAFYIIESGQVEVTVGQDGQERVVDGHGPGGYIGEIALLLDTPRTASVKAVTPTRTLTLYKADFDRLVADHLYVSRGLERVMSRRMIQIRRTLPAAS